MTVRVFPGTSGDEPKAKRRWRALVAVCRSLWLRWWLSRSRADLLPGPAALDPSSYRFTPLATEPADEDLPLMVSGRADRSSTSPKSTASNRFFTRTLDSAISTQIAKSSTRLPDTVLVAGRRSRLLHFLRSRRRAWSVGATVESRSWF